MWARMLGLLACVGLVSACTGDDGMQGTFRSLADQPPPGAATPDGTTTAASAEADCPPDDHCLGRPRRTGVFDAQALPEASGAARSLRDPELLWLVDDAPGQTRLWAVQPDGSVIADVPIAGTETLNVEALASGPCGADDEQPCLYVGDIGDNVRAREHVRVLRVPEPDLSAGAPESLSATAVSLRYPGERHDAEALLVDGDGVPYLVTKASFDAASGVTAPTHLFAAPGFRDGMLLDLGVVTLPEPEVPVATLFYGNTVTGGDAGPGRVLLRTYDQAVEFVAPTPDASLGEFPSWPSRRVPAPWQPQAEAVAYADGHCGYWTVSEDSGDIWLVPCQSQEPERTARTTPSDP